MTAPGGTSGYYSASPQIHLDGNLNSDLSDGLESIMVEETTEGLYRCEAIFENWGSHQGQISFLYFDRSVIEFGRQFAVTAGDGSARSQIFSGMITGIEGHFPQQRPPTVAILAEDRFQDLRMMRRTRSFESMNDADVMQQITTQHGLQADIDIDGPTYSLLAQVNQSDLAFLRDRARAVDAEVWVEDSTFHAKERGSRHAGDVTLTYGQGLLEFSVLADLAQQRSSVTVTGWDVAGKSTISHTAGDSVISGEINGHASGSSVLNQAFGERKEQIVHFAPVDAEEARYRAEADYRQMARRFLSGQGLCQGDGRIRVGVTVELNNVGTLFDGKYYVSEVRHTFNQEDGYQTFFRVQRPGLGQ